MSSKDFYLLDSDVFIAAKLPEQTDGSWRTAGFTDQ